MLLVTRSACSSTPLLAGRFGGRLEFLGGNLAVAIFIKAQKEWAWCIDKFATAHTPVFVLVKVGKIGISKHWISTLDRPELFSINVAPAIAISNVEHAIDILFPFIAGIYTVVIGIPSCQRLQ